METVPRRTLRGKASAGDVELEGNHVSKLRVIARNKWLRSALTVVAVIEVAGAPIKWG